MRAPRALRCRRKPSWPLSFVLLFKQTTQSQYLFRALAKAYKLFIINADQCRVTLKSRIVPFKYASTQMVTAQIKEHTVFVGNIPYGELRACAGELFIVPDFF